MPTVQWEPIDGFPGYLISNDGRVYSEKTDTEMAQQPINDGYFIVGMYRNGDTDTKYVHRLVIEHFGPEPPSGDHEVNHKDGDKSNNHIDNLEWVTNQQNDDHARENYLKKAKGRQNNTNKLSVKDVLEIRVLYRNTDASQPELGEAYGVTHSQIGTIVRREQWTHIPPINRYRKNSSNQSGESNE